MIIYVFNEDSNQMEQYQRCLDEAMPYTTKKHLTVRAFKGKVMTQVMWTTKHFLESFEELINQTHVCFEVEQGFYRGWHEVEDDFYVHKLGVAIKGGHNLSVPMRTKLARMAEDSGNFYIMDPIEESAITVFDANEMEGIDSEVVPFQTIRQGDMGMSVFVLQDNLWSLGYAVNQLNGKFDSNLNTVVRQFQNDQQLTVDGIVGRLTWESLMRLIHPDDERLNAPLE